MAVVGRAEKLQAVEQAIKFAERAYLVPMSDIGQYWPYVRPAIKRALERTAIGNIARVEKAVAWGEARLWVVYAGKDCVGTGVTFVENGVCNVWAYAGDLKRFHLYPELKRYALSEGCHTIRAVGPRAWLRVLGPEWKVTAYVIERSV